LGKNRNGSAAIVLCLIFLVIVCKGGKIGKRIEEGDDYTNKNLLLYKYEKLKH
jgi:hypothetical protein